MDSFIVISLIKAFVVFAVLITTLAYLQWVERKVIAHIQVRPGPYRVGPHGLLQPLADVIKLITKEDLLPPYVNKPLYLAAPFLAITMALLSISVIPFGPTIQVAGYQTMMQLTDLNIGVLFILAVSSMGVYGIALAGWSSNNKYALLGGLRSSAARPAARICYWRSEEHTSDLQSRQYLVWRVAREKKKHPQKAIARWRLSAHYR